jgi:hypothetical protein
MAGLDEWPAHRREALLWHYSLELDYDGVDDLVRSAESGACDWQWNQRHDGHPTAKLGDDGRYHLLRAGVLLCSEVRQPTLGQVQFPVNGLHPHQRQFSWWTDGDAYRIFPPPSTVDWQDHVGSNEVRWSVGLAAVEEEPTTVPPRLRCNYSPGRSEWPPFINEALAVGRLRRRLIDHGGPMCHACGLRTGVTIDHDHFTGLVRGLLCAHCNTRVDYCTHLTNCRWAAYLNEPPALALGLRHHAPKKVRKDHQRRIELMGFDPFP